MNKFARILLVLALPFALAHCGKSDDQKAQDKATSIVDEHNRLLNEAKNETPTVDWSDEKLNAYAAKLDRIESLGKEAYAMDGKNRVNITGGDNRAFLALSRSMVQLARVNKIANAAKATAQARGDNAQAAVNDYLKQAEAKKISERDQLVAEISAWEKLSPDAKEEELKAREAKLNELSSTEQSIGVIRLQLGENEALPDHASEIEIAKNQIADVRAKDQKRKEVYDSLLKAQAEFKALPMPTNFDYYASTQTNSDYLGKLDDLLGRVNEISQTPVREADDEVGRGITQLKRELPDQIKKTRAEWTR